LAASLVSIYGLGGTHFKFVSDALTFRASASDFAPSELMLLPARLSYKQEAREADTVSIDSKTRSARVGELGGADKKRAPVSMTR
jgi:hypothetical protein